MPWQFLKFYPCFSALRILSNTSLAASVCWCLLFCFDFWIPMILMNTNDYKITNWKSKWYANSFFLFSKCEYMKFWCKMHTYSQEVFSQTLGMHPMNDYAINIWHTNWTAELSWFPFITSMFIMTEYFGK